MSGFTYSLVPLGEESCSGFCWVKSKLIDKIYKFLKVNDSIHDLCQNTL